MTRTVFWLSQIVLISLIVWSAHLVYEQFGLLPNDYALDITWALGALAIKGLTVLVAALKFRELCRLFGIRLQVNEWIGLSVVPTFHNFFSPAQTGHILRAIYLKNSYEFNYFNYVSSVIFVNVIEASLAIGIFACIATLALELNVSLPTLASIGYWLIAGAVLVFFVLCGRVIARSTGKLAHIARIVQQGRSAFLSKRAFLVRVVGLCALSIGFRWLGLYACFRALNFDVGFADVLLLECIRTLSGLIYITPSNIGISEVVLTTVGVALGIPSTTTLPSAVLSRLFTMFLYSSAGIWYSRLLFAGIVLRQR